MLGGAKPPISGQGRGPRSEAQRTESGVGFSKRVGQPAPSLPARRSGERCKLPPAGLGAELRSLERFLHFSGARRPLLELVGGQVRGGMAALLLP